MVSVKVMVGLGSGIGLGLGASKLYKAHCRQAIPVLVAAGCPQTMQDFFYFWLRFVKIQRTKNKKLIAKVGTVRVSVIRRLTWFIPDYATG